MSLSHAQCLAFVEERIAAFSPPDTPDAAEVKVRLPQVVKAMSSLPSGSAFGFDFPEDVRAEVIPQATALVAAAIDRWRAWLTEHFGEQGAHMLPPPADGA
jgi:hypothetical protein